MGPARLVATFLPPLPREHWRRRTDALDPETSYEQVVRVVAQHEFPWDVQQALSFALFRTYAVPSIGGLLHETRAFADDAQRRHDDTVLLLAAPLESGLDSGEGRAAVRRINRQHGHYDIADEDLRYVLAAFVVTPVRWLERYGWRRLTDTEVRASVRYYQRLGALMGIPDLPADYAGFARLLDDHEAEHVRPDPRTREVADATMDLLCSFYPPPLRPAMRLFSVALLDPHLRDAFGYDAPPRAVVAAAHAGLRLRGRVVRWLPPRRLPRLTSDSSRIRSYPGGHLVEQLGAIP
ncbi:oxygenase MpaB family protein [Lapillicoccus jejuensis]|uniref:Uncharacterized protein DUF2236 n=1 Tax=Lapillicoccus jejuensis TaxID=402171 RepID=A0A542E4I1_9MICO|nr:oxygenase MpaB family protein [Lapillicoccus jejuensis]TQJ10250.1 uncharacterized protein DUF2236 [Lapillicoccus jejuensis]